MPPPATGAAATAAAARAATASQADLLIGDPAAMTPVVSTLGPRMPGMAPGAPDGAASPRVRLVRDAAVALIGLVVVGLVVLNFFPQQSPVAPPSSTQFVSVVEESPTPEPTPRPTATKAAAVATASPTPSPTPLVTATPAPTPKPTPKPTEGRAALHPEADGAPDRGAHASADAEADAEAHRETDPQADADSRNRSRSPSSLARRSRCCSIAMVRRRRSPRRTRGPTGTAASASGANPPGHLYTQAGTYQVKLTVTNSSGSDSDTQSYTVP